MITKNQQDLPAACWLLLAVVVVLKGSSRQLVLLLGWFCLSKRPQSKPILSLNHIFYDSEVYYGACLDCGGRQPSCR